MPAIGFNLNRDEHLNDMGKRTEEVVWLVKEAMTQSCTDENTEKAIDKEGVKQLIFYLLVFIKPLHHEVCSN